MKKAVMFLLLACASITVSGCKEKGAGGASHFKEFIFTGTVDQIQRNKIGEGIQKNASLLRSIVTTSDRHEKSAFSKLVSTGESTVKFLEDPTNPNLLIVTTSASSNSEQTSDGITIKQKTKTEIKQWDGGSGSDHTYKIETTNGVEKKTLTSSAVSTDSAVYKNATILGQLNLIPDSYTIFTNSNGSFDAVMSDITKNVSGVQWGSEVKEYIKEQRTQTVYSVSKDYRLTSVYTYQEYSSNRDESTGEWLGSVQVYYRNYVSYEYKYGTREKGSIKDLTKLLTTK